MSIRTLPNLQYTQFDFELQRYVSQSESGNGLINNVEYAEPRWMVSVATRGYQDNGKRPDDGLPTLDAIKAFWASLRGGVRTVIVRHPVYSHPRLNRDTPDKAKKAGQLSGIADGNKLTVTGVDAGLLLSMGDYVSLTYNGFYALGMIIASESNVTTRTIEIEPRLPRYIQVGATVHFDRIELLTRPINDSFSMDGEYPYRNVKFQLMECQK